MPFYHARNEQAMVHAAVGYARQKNRLSTLACTSSIGPGATNMVTGAALATINRLPVLLLPGDVFATRAPGTGAAGARGPDDATACSVNDTLRPVSRFWDRVERPEQLDPRAAGGDARADRPGRDRRGHAVRCRRTCRPRRSSGRRSCSRERVWRVRRPLPEPDVLARAAELIRRRAAAADRRRRRHDLRRGDRRAARVRRGDRDRRRRDAGRQGLAALRPPAGARRDRRHRHDRRQRRRPRGRRDARRRHALERLHDRVASPVRRGRDASSTSTSPRVDAYKHAGAAARRRRAASGSRR